MKKLIASAIVAATLGLGLAVAAPPVESAEARSCARAATAQERSACQLRVLLNQQRALEAQLSRMYETQRIIRETVQTMTR